ncbi:AIR synthase-related protein, partial [Staphylococcus warneri]
SSGIHSNGYSLVRNLIKKSNVDLQEKFDAQRTYLETFLEPTRLYVKPVLAVKEAIQINAMTHITGGGFYENIPRALPEG